LLVASAAATKQQPLVLSLQVVSKDVFIKMNALKDQRRSQGWTHVEWELLDADKLSKNVACVQARCGVTHRQQ
jgi:hypothetical protein